QNVETQTQAQSSNCENPQTQTQMNICAAQEFARVDAELNQRYQELLPKLSQQRKDQLIKAQKAWIAFKETSCEFEASQVAGGSMEPLVRANCLTEQTTRRTADLQRYLQETNL
ncbi:MAG: lysozyme inhibitor LprI family protein, partial [Cyanobacteria bacterium P01_G01_bin.49]